MTDGLHRVSGRSAYEDLQQRTLASIPSDFARLIYLATMRDYNSGMYHHEGLAGRYGTEETRNALQLAHEEIFWRLVSMPLEDLVHELESYVQVSHEAPESFIRAWEELEPYRVAVPMEVDGTMVRLFLSNIKLALEVLRFRQGKNQARQPASSLQPLLGR